MHRVTSVLPILFAFILTAVGISLAATTSGSEGSTNTKATMRTNANQSKSNASQAKPSAKNVVLASPEKLKGTISFVDPSDKEVTLVGSNGVPYDFTVNKKTQLDLADHKIGRNELSDESHKQATVRFVPRADGNLAERIQIKAS